LRRVAKFNNGKKAEEFSSILRGQNIEYYLEKDREEFVFWIKNEDQIILVKKYYEAFLAGTLQELPKIETEIEKEEKEELERAAFKRIKIEEEEAPLLIPFRGTLTKICIILSVALYCVSFYQGAQVAQGGKYIPFMKTICPIQAVLMYDYPEAFSLSNKLNAEYPINTKGELSTLPPEGESLLKEIEENLPWVGLYELFLNWGDKNKYKHVKLFENISKGEVWRLVTPIFLHGGVLHILFNMLWLWLFGKMVENTMGKGPFILFVISVAIVTNTLQYIMTGPLFMGFSGVISAFAGYIWVRKKKAPWEIFPVDKSTLVFLWIFIFGMFALQIIAFFLQFFHIIFLPMGIANTAHMSGLLLGMWMARIPLFQRKL
jgi:GlpG protein